MSGVHSRVPTEEQARVEARAAHMVYMAVLASQSKAARPWPGLRLANALFHAGDWGWDETFDAALGVLAGFRIGALSGPVASPDAFVDAASAYLAAFSAEFRRIRQRLLRRSTGGGRDARVRHGRG